MAEAFANSDLLKCEQCHGYHEVKKTSDKMVGVGDSSTCTVCHEPGDGRLNFSPIRDNRIFGHDDNSITDVIIFCV